MSTDKTRLENLFERYFSGTATPEENAELAKLVGENNDRDLTDLLAKSWEKFEKADTIISPEKTKAILQHILGKGETGKNVYFLQSNNKIKPMWMRYAAAAVIISLLGVGTYFLFFNNSGRKNDIVKTNNSILHDVKAPASNRAMITLSNGAKLYLDDSANGMLATQSNVTLVKTGDGQIAYNKSSKISPEGLEGAYNTLTNPRGSKVIDMRLADGSRIWLNSGSALRYPVAFTGNERKIEIIGEAYFEVAHDASKPFKVDVAGRGQVEVLGTHFNIDAYIDEAFIKTTLLEGAVKVSAGNRLQTLAPGQQAQISKSDEIILMNNADVELAIAWKNGYISFRNADLKSIMRQVARWYDVNVVYEGNIPERIFTGDISRNLNVSVLLKVLEESNIHFRVENKTITVLP